MRLGADGTGRCRRCQVTKPAAGFYPLAYGGKGVRGVCRDCTAQDRRNTYAAGTSVRSRDGAWLKRLREQGLDVETVTARLEEQGGRCAACRSLPDAGRRLGVDVADGRLRGLLCQRCALLAGSEAEVLRAVAAYLESVRV
jgi:hypothetical protein